MVGKEKNPYAGRWVARMHGQIVAQGGTPEQVRRAARGIRSKETPEIVYMPTLDEMLFSPLMDSIRLALPPELPVYLVGGAVRDAILGRPTHDLDYALDHNGIRTAQRVANALKADFYPLDPERDTGRVIVTSQDGSRTFIDFATFRGSDLESDLRGRDFTVNAVAMDVRSGALYDPLSGLKDLKSKHLRLCSPSACADDPVRILRGVRLAAAFGFHISPETRQAMKQAAGLLKNISPERLRDELFRILEGPQPATCVRALEALGALNQILPELAAQKNLEQPAPHVSALWTHTLATLQQLESALAVLAPDYNPESAPDLYSGLLVLRLGRYREKFGEYFTASLNVNRSQRGLLFLAALYHDVGKPASKKTDPNGQLRFWGHDQQGAEMAAERARQLSLSNDEIERLSIVIRNHMRIHYFADRFYKEHKEPSRRAIYRFFRAAGPAGVDLVLLALADCRATYEQTLLQDVWAAYVEVCRLLLENWWEKPAESIAPPALLDGKDLMAVLDLPQGPQIGELLEAIREAQATGEVNTRQQALALAWTLIDKGKASV